MNKFPALIRQDPLWTSMSVHNRANMESNFSCCLCAQRESFHPFQEVICCCKDVQKAIACFWKRSREVNSNQLPQTRHLRVKKELKGSLIGSTFMKFNVLLKQNRKYVKYYCNYRNNGLMISISMTDTSTVSIFYHHIVMRFL